jgi:hypothetical protein
MFYNLYEDTCLRVVLLKHLYAIVDDLQSDVALQSRGDHAI